VWSKSFENSTWLWFQTTWIRVWFCWKTNLNGIWKIFCILPSIKGSFTRTTFSIRWLLVLRTICNIQGYFQVERFKTSFIEWAKRQNSNLESCWFSIIRCSEFNILVENWKIWICKNGDGSEKFEEPDWWENEILCRRNLSFIARRTIKTVPKMQRRQRVAEIYIDWER